LQGVSGCAEYQPEKGQPINDSEYAVLQDLKALHSMHKKAEAYSSNCSTTWQRNATE
jgi:hypothetical protein